MTQQQKQEIKDKRLSGNFTLQEIADQYGITRERIRQIVGIGGLKKQKVLVCKVCGKNFATKSFDRNRCKQKCRPPLKSRPCKICKNPFTPKTIKNLNWCVDCYPVYRKQRARDTTHKWYVRKRKLIPTK